MIIPAPAVCVRRPGEFVVGSVVHITAAPGVEQAADLLAGYLRRPISASGPEIRLRLSDAIPPPEAYQLEITPEKVDLCAGDVRGVLRGVQTLRQLLPASTLAVDAPLDDAWRWPCMFVADQPRLAWRGVLLDVARHFMPLDFLYRFVDLAAFHKLNVVHLHLTDDQGWRFEVDGWPRLTEIGAWRTGSMHGSPAHGGRVDDVPHGGYYTQAELRALDRFAAARGVTIVPEIDMPGHTRAAIAAYPELGNNPESPLVVWNRWGISPDILGAHSRAIRFCREVLDQTADIFASRVIHIGGDECPSAQWETHPVAIRRARLLGLSAPAQLHGWFLRQMRDHLARLGRRTGCWDETGHAEGEPPADAILYAWRAAEHGAAAIKKGRQVLMTPHLSTYLDYPQTEGDHEHRGHPGFVTTLDEVYAFDPLAGGLPLTTLDNQDPGVLGTQASLWTEHAPTPDHVLHQCYPRLCALADRAWSIAAADYADFTTRMVVHEQRLRALDAWRRVSWTEPGAIPVQGGQPASTAQSASRMRKS